MTTVAPLRARSDLPSWRAFLARLAGARRDGVLALRNVLRHKRRSAIALAAVAFGVIALVLANSFVEWILWAMREMTIRSQLGHIQITAHGYRESGRSDPFKYMISPDAPSRNDIPSFPHVKIVTPRISFNGLVSHGDSTLSFSADGVIPAQENAIRETLPLYRSGLNIVAGKDMSNDDPMAIVMGQGLAANLGVGVGDSVVLLANTASGGINAVEVRVVGLFSTISKAYDDTALQMHLETAHRLLRSQGDHVLVVLLDDTARTSEVAAQIAQRLEGAGFEVTPWYRLSDFYNKTAELFSKQSSVVRMIIGLIIVLSISNTLMMSVMERTSEIGTAMALGVRRLQILGQFVLEGAVLGVLGGAIGLGIATVAAHAISAIGIPMPPPPGQSWGYTGEMKVTGAILLDAFTLAVATAVLASLYPAWKASRLVIVDALRASR